MFGGMVLLVSWMGRYRAVVEALVRHGNMIARVVNQKGEVYPGILLTQHEWQVLEYIIEHENDDSNMIRISERLAIPQSSFSKITKLLCEYHLIAKYRISGNRKNIILKSTEFGQEVYLHYSGIIQNGIFRQFFENLEPLSDDQLETFSQAIRELDDTIQNDSRKTEKRELIRLDD